LKHYKICLATSKFCECPPAVVTILQSNQGTCATLRSEPYIANLQENGVT